MRIKKVYLLWASAFILLSLTFDKTYSFLQSKAREDELKYQRIVTKKENEEKKQTEEEKNLQDLRKAENLIQTKQIEVLSAQNSLNQQFLLNDNSGLPLLLRSEEDKFSYNIAAKAINKKILETNELIRSYNQTVNPIKNEKWFKNSELPNLITELNYVFLISEKDY